MPEETECTYCRKKYSAKSMKIHLRYYWGPHARLTEKQAKQETNKKTDLGKGKWKKVIKAKKGKKKEIKPEKGKRKKEKVDDEVDTCGIGAASEPQTISNSTEGDHNKTSVIMHE